jgi:LPS-assembly protein
MGTTLFFALMWCLGQGPTPGFAHISGERELHDGATEITSVEGHAKLLSDGLALDADRLVYDQRRGVITAVGHVVGRITQGGLTSILADVVTVRLADQQVRDVWLLEGRAQTRASTTPEALLAASTPEELAHTGVVATVLEGNHLVHEGTVWTVEQLDLVPCDCNFDDPSWSIHSNHAAIDTEAERASVVFPSVWIHHVPYFGKLPILWFPWLSVPLTNRQSGLLFPKPMFGGQNGVGVELPVFITLGRSADLTLTPGYFGGDDTQVMGIRGPRLVSELRYVPSASASGRVTLTLLDDLRLARDPANAGLLVDNGTPWFPARGRQRGLRGDASWQHVQDLGAGWGVHVDAVAQSDGYYNRDFTTDVIASQLGYVRSTAAVFRRTDTSYLGLDVTLRQDLSWGYNLLRPTDLGPGSTAPVGGPRPFHRLPAVQWALPLFHLVGPLAFDARADFVRLAPLGGLTGDEGALANQGRTSSPDGLPYSTECLRQRLYYAGGLGKPDQTFTPNAPPLVGCNDLSTDLKAGQGDGVFQAGEREARDRLHLRPRLVLAGQPVPGLMLSAAATWRQLFWLGEVSGTFQGRGYAVLDARAETELARTFADETLRHAIVPSLQLKTVPFVTGAPRAPAGYDEIDFAYPEDAHGRLQAVGEVRQYLALKEGGGVREALRLDVGQGVDLVGPGYVRQARAADGSWSEVTLTLPRLAETYGRLSGSYGWFNLQALARLDLVARQATRLQGSASLDDHRGHALAVTYDYLLDDGTNRTHQPMDLLFGGPVQSGATTVQGVGFFARYRAGPIALGYDLSLGQKALNLDPTQPTRQTALSQLALVQHRVQASWMPACDCWRVDLYARESLKADLTPQMPEFGATVTVSGFGTIGSAK